MPAPLQCALCSINEPPQPMHRLAPLQIGALVTILKMATTAALMIWLNDG